MHNETPKIGGETSEQKSEKGGFSGWKNETEERSFSVSVFLEKHFKKPLKERSRYDSFTELHFSGTNSEVMQKIRERSADILEVNVLYKNDNPGQIHVVFSSEGKGHNIDVYLAGKALEEYLTLLIERENKKFLQ